MARSRLARMFLTAALSAGVLVAAVPAVALAEESLKADGTLASATGTATTTTFAAFDVDFGNSFSSLTRVCADIDFGADDPLDPGEVYAIRGLGGQTNTRDQPLYRTTLCGNHLHPNWLPHFLDGEHRVEVEVQGSGSATVAGVAIEATGTPVPPVGFRVSLSGGVFDQPNVPRGATLTRQLTVTSAGDLPADPAVELSARTNMPGASVTVSPSSGTGTFTATVQITTSATAPQGFYGFVLTARGGGFTRTATQLVFVFIDDDGDGRRDDFDNCPGVANASQSDGDRDGIGDACDPDLDGDGHANEADNCPDLTNADQANLDGDARGDACDPDRDGDTVANDADNCPVDANTDQRDIDGDGAGDVCDADRDGDAITNASDNCADVTNPTQADLDVDGVGDVCDGDRDGDTRGNDADNCPDTPNADQADQDGDGTGDGCDSDRDGDGVPDASDNCPTTDNAGQGDLDGDAVGDACDPDRDGDGHANAADNCADAVNADQADWDGDGEGDACDAEKPPAQQITETAETVEGLAVPAGTKRSLGGKLQGALEAYNAGKIKVACSKLDSFVHEVEAQSGKKIATADANALLDQAAHIRVAIGCQ